MPVAVGPSWYSPRMADPTLVTHELAVSLLTRKLNKDNIKALLSSWLSAITTLDAELVGLQAAMTDPNVAEGAQLDVLARIVGALDLVDEAVQRIFTLTQIQANKSSGTPEDLLGILRVLFPGEEFLEEVPPAAVRVGLPFSVSADVARAAGDVFRRAKAAGVRIEFFYSLEAEGDTFAFSSTSSPEADATRGFSSTAAPSTGGALTGVESH